MTTQDLDLCSEHNCGRVRRAKGLCSGHYKQMRKGQILTVLIWNEPNPDREPKASRTIRGINPCAIRGCDKLDKVKGFCGPHYQTLRTYGISPEMLAAVLNKEVGCDLCGSTVRLVFDHDHNCCPDPRALSKGITCGKCLRGVLCTICNTALGMLKEDRALLERMISYITPKAA